MTVHDPVTHRPVPRSVDGSFAPYFAALDDHRIAVPQCTDCATLQFPPREVCGVCQSGSFDWEEVPTTGKVYTYTIVYRAFHPWFAERTPYGIVVAELAAGVRVLGACFDDDVDRLDCGTEVRAHFARVGDVTVVDWRMT